MTTTTATTATHLRLIISHWPDLADALAASNVSAWPPSGLRAHLAAVEREETDEDEARRHRDATARAHEGLPTPLAITPAPLVLGIYDTMRTVEQLLLATADATAEHVQRPPMPMPAPGVLLTPRRGRTGSRGRITPAASRLRRMMPPTRAGGPGPGADRTAGTPRSGCWAGSPARRARSGRSPPRRRSTSPPPRGWPSVGWSAPSTSPPGRRASVSPARTALGPSASTAGPAPHPSPAAPHADGPGRRPDWPHDPCVNERRFCHAERDGAAPRGCCPIEPSTALGSRPGAHCAPAPATFRGGHPCVSRVSRVRARAGT